jgi:hypothetical protein
VLVPDSASYFIERNDLISRKLEIPVAMARSIFIHVAQFRACHRQVQDALERTD